MQISPKGWIAITLFLFVAWLFEDVWRSSAPDEVPTPAETVGAVDMPVRQAGSSARAYIEGSQSLYLAVDREAMDELIDVQNALDVDGLRQLARQGQVFSIPNNTLVEVVDGSALLTKVRVTEQGRVYSGREGWLAYEAVVSAERDEEALAGLPEYTVLDRIGDYVEVLLPSVEPSTPVSQLETIARGIAEAERVGTLHLYKTEAAQQAHLSDSFAERHPDALADGYLGGFKNGEFQPSSY